MRFAILFLVFTLAACGRPDVVKQTEGLIETFTATNKVNNWPRLGPLESWHLAVDTYTHDVPSSTIQSLYYLTCKKLDSLYRDETVTYRWNDEMGYPGQVTIVQFRNEARGDFHLATGVFEANDNDSFWFSYIEGDFDVSKMIKMKSWKLERILRCNQGKAE